MHVLHHITHNSTTNLICLLAATTLTQYSLLPQCPASIMSPQPDDQWLIKKLGTLLASPYIHFKNPGGPLGIRLGPGPVDLFSTNYENLFAKEAKGVVYGKEVDRDELKEALLAIQRQWNPDSANFVPLQSANPGEVKSDLDDNTDVR